MSSKKQRYAHNQLGDAKVKHTTRALLAKLLAAVLEVTYGIRNTEWPRWVKFVGYETMGHSQERVVGQENSYM